MAMSLDCQRWVALADREAVGEVLAAGERAFQRSHEASCAECTREAAVWRALKSPPADAAPEAEEVERILALAARRRTSSAPVPLPQRWRTAALAASVVACAAALVLWWTGANQRSAGGGQMLAKGALTIGSSLRRTAAASAASNAPPVEAGARPRCSEVIAGAMVCLARGAVLANRKLEGPDRALEVARGRAVVSLSPQPRGTSFSLSTAAGKVTAVGTIFSVEVAADGSTIARVIEGHVLARVGEASGVSVRAGQSLRLGEQHPTPLSEQDRDLDLELLSWSGSLERESAGPSSTAKPEPREAAATPADMLEYARSLRANGDFRRAADVYRRIHAANPQNPSGRAALVSLGELLLSLNDGREALNAFDSYLASGGALTQEAMFGRARALRALHRPAEERRAIERFIAAYPNSPQTRVLRARLAAMQK
jgi:ferric-dicitrate binding protein FerR (iron transport regulator)